MASMATATAPSQASQGAAKDKINYLEDAEKCKAFLDEYAVELQPGRMTRKYKQMLLEIANRKRQVLQVDLDDMMGHFGDDNLLERITSNTLRYIEIFAGAADQLMPKPTDPDVMRALGGDFHGEHTQEIFRIQRMQQIQNSMSTEASANASELEDTDDPENPSDTVNRDPHYSIPPELMRRFEVVITPPAKVAATSLRDVSAGQIGKLVRIKGIVTRVADVKPRAVVVVYLCDKCGHELYQRVEEKGEFTPVQKCTTQACTSTRGEQGRVFPLVRGSKFEKFQEVKIQETPDQVPVGHIPRTLTVHCRGSSTRQCSPGDCIEVVGIFLPLGTNAFHQMKMGLETQTYLSCMKIKRHKKNYAELSNDLTADIEDEIDDILEGRDHYDRLSQSIAPEIFGLQDVKKALLLQLVGGVTRKMNDGMSIRGDLNVLLMGDPGVAKSQLLKYISSIAPRGVYTTGKGSSGVGLTACVTRDKSTGEVALEGGALVLADMGICAIDEFDKMEESDRTAIHEVMEQQTVSIAKAGVTTTLNARTSILAAANPLYGRYNKRYSPADNINLPAALLSRFDLIFLLLDQANLDNDLALARHITFVHKNSKHPALDFTPVSPKLLRAYISQARKVEPNIPPALCNSIVEEYVNMRQADLKDANESGSQSMLTARQLLSILRMSQALARLRFDEQVTQADVLEAIRLVKVSKKQLDEDESQDYTPGDDVITRLFGVIREYATANNTSVIRYAEVEPIVLNKGFTADQLDACLAEYEALDVFQLNAARTTIHLVS
mmetsp:Transcript_20127/g.35773  ORF Transcript_20127/g.35773 Transcript_20127/m.35773 type:complete len:781 (+) Transcript_20127:182-2524(+)